MNCITSLPAHLVPGLTVPCFLRQERTAYLLIPGSLLLLWISMSPGLMWPFAFPNKIERSTLCAKFRYFVVFLYAYSANNASQLYTSRNIICSVNQSCGPEKLLLNLFQDSCGKKLKYYSHFQGVRMVSQEHDICCLSSGIEAGFCQPHFLASTSTGSCSSSERVGCESDVYCHKLGFGWHSSVSSSRFA